MNVADLVISGSVSGVIGAITGIFFGIFSKRITYLIPARKLLCTMAEDSQQLRIFFRIFPIPEHSGIVDLPTNIIVGQLHGIPEITSTASAKCLSFVLAFLLSARSSRNMDIIDSERFRDSDLDSNIICIGGPVTNKVTKKILESKESWIPFTFEEGKIKRVDGTQEWAITGDVDYGTIIKTRNPFSKKKWVLIFFGLFGDGSVAASYFFQDRFKDIVSQFGDKSFGIVVRVTRSIGYLSAVQVDYAIPQEQLAER